MIVKYCTNCGTKTTPKTTFCDECGMKLEESKSKRNLEPKIQTSNLQTLIKDSKETGWRQINAIKEIGTIQTSDAVKHLITLLAWKQIDRKYDVNGRAKKLSDEEQLESFNVRKAAAESLIKLGKLSVEPLISLLENDFSEYSSESVVDKKIASIYRKSNTDGEYYVKNHATYILGKIGDERALDVIYKCFMYADYPIKYDFEDIVYSPFRTVDITVAMNALIKCGKVSEGALEKVIQGFIRTLSDLKQGLYLEEDGSMDRKSDGSYNDRLSNSASALAYLGQPSIDPLLKLFSQKPEIEKEVMAILGSIKGRKVFDQIIQRLSVPKGNSENPEDWGWIESNQELYSLIREIIIEYGPEGNALLIEALQDGDSMVRLGASRGMGLVGHPSYVNPLTAATSDHDSNVAFAALGALRRTTGNLEKLPYNDVEWIDLKLITEVWENKPVKWR
jgi:HEAT repeat protein